MSDTLESTEPAQPSYSRSWAEEASAFQQLLEQMSSAVAIYRAVDDGDDFVFVDFNPAAEEIEGVSRADVVGRRVTEVFPAVADFGLLEVFRRVWRNGTPERHPVTQYRDDRISGWRENRVFRLPGDEIAALYDDRTPEKQIEKVQQKAEDALRQAQRRLHATSNEAAESVFKELADNAPVMIWRAGLAGLCDWFNKPWLEFVGRPMEQELGDGWAEGVHPGDLDRCLDVYRTAFEARESFTMVYRLRRADGAYRQILDTGRPFNRNGEFAGYFGSCVDVTEQQAMEAQLRQAQKMEALGHITGGMAHDFNNLLHVIRVNLDLLARDLRALGEDFSANGLVQERLTKAMNGLDRGSKLASHLLAYARRQPLHPKVVNLGKLMLEADGILRDALGDAVDLETVVATELWNTRIDAVQFETALLNLAINARDAMEGRGTFRIGFENLDIDARGAKALGNFTAGQYVVVSATDTGCGMSQQTKERAFDPFFTTKGEGSGTGLGLSTIQGFIKQSGGHIRIESELGRGATFRIYLPRCPEREETVEAQVRPPRVPDGPVTILLVEDDDNVRAMTAEMLAELGYVVLEAPDADSAMATIQGGARFDVLFTDVVVPGSMGSAELARAAVERRPGVGVLYTSGHGYNELVDRGELHQGGKLLSKPYTQEELDHSLMRILAQSGSSNAQA